MMTKLLGNIGLLLLYPLAPFLQDVWNLSSDQMSLLNVISESAAFPAGFLTPYGDVFGNYHLVVGSYVLTTVSIILLLAPPVFGWLLLLRFAFNFAYTVFSITVQSEMVSIVGSKEKGWVTGLLEMTFSVAILCCAALVVVFNYVNWHATFAILGGLMAPFIFEVWWNFPKSIGQQQEQEQEEPTYRKNSVPRHFLQCFTLATTCFFLSAVFINIAHNAIYSVTFYLFSDEFGFGASDMAFVLLSIGLGQSLGSLLVTFFSDRNIYLGLYLGTAAFAVGIIAMIFTHSALGIILVLFFLYVGAEYTFIVSIAEIEAFMPAQFRTTVIGIHFQAQFLGRAVGAQLAESFYDPWGVDSVLYASLGAVTLHAFCVTAAKQLKIRQD